MNEDSSTRLGALFAMPPLLVGASAFNAALAAELTKLGDLQLISWKRPYPPFLYRRGVYGGERAADEAEFLVDWLDPRTWRRALERWTAHRVEALLLPWLHPVWAPQYRWILRRRPAPAAVICHNVLPHEPLPLLGRVTRATLSAADLFVTHAPHQSDELAAVGLGSTPVLELFHPRFPVTRSEDRDAQLALRSRYGDPATLLLMYGAIRPYKGLDLALAALARVVADGLDVHLLVAGRFWESRQRYDESVRRHGLENVVTLDDRFIPDNETAVMFAAADLALLPYLSASQSGVAQLALAYGCPVVATAVGGLPDAVRDGYDGVLVDPSVEGVANGIRAAIESLPQLRETSARSRSDLSFGRYAELLVDRLLHL
jgi:glycosyltransferase involved in cell wall biosynthesis